MDALTRVKALRLGRAFAMARVDDDCDVCPGTLTSPDRVVMPDAPITAAAATMADALVYPADHFRRWDTRAKEQRPLTFHPDGRVTGHIAGTGCFRNGDTSRCTRYKRDPDPQMANFHTWTTTLDNGRVVRTGALTAGSNHADVSQPLEAARAYHENTSTVIARVQAWEDSKGRLAVTGSVVPGVDLDFLGQAAGAPVSIEQWPTVETNGRNTLVAAHMVVSPAWPVS